MLAGHEKVSDAKGRKYTKKQKGFVVAGGVVGIWKEKAGTDLQVICFSAQEDHEEWQCFCSDPSA